jgi:hypothetical protein
MSALSGTNPAAAAMRRPVALMFTFTLLSWLGEFVHNLKELPQLTVLSPENSIPAAVSLALFGLWWLSPFKRGAALLLLAWALLHLVGGAILSVIPFGFLPFYPEQSPGHYAAHVLYGVAQLPLAYLALKQLRAR